MGRVRMTILPIVCLLAALAQPAAAKVTVELRATAEVARDYVRLRDVAAIDGAETEREELAAIYIGPAPEKGGAVRFSRWEVEARLLARGVREGAFEMTGADSVKIERAGRIACAEALPAFPAAPLAAPAPAESGVEVTTAKVAAWETMLPAVAREEMLHALGVPGAEAEAEFVRFLRPPAAGTAAETVRLLTLPERLQSGAATIGFELCDREGLRLETVEASFRIQVRLPAVAAARTVRRGEILGLGDLQTVLVEGAGVEGIFTDPAAAVGLRARTTLRAGAAITLGVVEVAPVVEKKQIVRIAARSGSFRIQHFARAEEAGAAGAIVRVRNVDTGEPYLARILADGTAEAVVE